MKQPPVITAFIMENYPGYLEFMAAHAPIRNANFSANEQAEFLVAVLPGLKTVYDADAYAAVLKKHLPEKIEPAALKIFAKQFFDFHFQRTRDRKNERLVIFYKCVAWCVLVQLAVFCVLFLLTIFYAVLLILPVIILAFSLPQAIRKSKHERLRPADHIAFIVNLAANLALWGGIIMTFV